jgi:hypothetical protein
MSPLTAFFTDHYMLTRRVRRTAAEPVSSQPPLMRAYANSKSHDWLSERSVIPDDYNPVTNERRIEWVEKN